MYRMPWYQTTTNFNIHCVRRANVMHPFTRRTLRCIAMPILKAIADDDQHRMDNRQWQQLRVTHPTNPTTHLHASCHIDAMYDTQDGINCILHVANSCPPFIHLQPLSGPLHYRLTSVTPRSTPCAWPPLRWATSWTSTTPT